ncbi:MAG: YCF48-related protein [Bacteroidetes bacterium]|nr:YCF48-related protein [Bacteroidota bacterium]
MKKLLCVLLFTLPVVAPAQWTALTSGTSSNLTSICFTDANTAYVAGSGGAILKTIDEGKTWTALSSGTDKSLYSIYFTDARVGYAVGANGTIIKTTDGGVTWTALPIVTSHYLTSVFFTNSDTGYIAGSGMDDNIFKTTDAGSTWTLLVNNNHAGPDLGLYSYSSVCFTDDSTGYLTGAFCTSMWGCTVMIAKTIDGGLRWEYLYQTGLGLSSVRFVNANTGFVTGASGTILKTIDGGTDWETLSSGTNRYLYSVHFIDTIKGFVVGDSGTILKTIDGGATWTAQLSGTTNLLRSVYFTNSDTGYAVGDHGAILKTTNGGTNLHGLNDLSIKHRGLNIYPNPSTDLVTIETLAAPARSQLSVMSLNGEEIMACKITEPKTTIDISNLKSGVYFVRWTSDLFVKMGKFVRY